MAQKESIWSVSKRS